MLLVSGLLALASTAHASPFYSQDVVHLVAAWLQRNEDILNIKTEKRRRIIFKKP